MLNIIDTQRQGLGRGTRAGMGVGEESPRFYNVTQGSVITHYLLYRLSYL